MFEHCTLHRPAAEVIYLSVPGSGCPLCSQLRVLRERVTELERLAQVLGRGPAARRETGETANVNER